MLYSGVSEDLVDVVLVHNLDPLSGNLSELGETHIETSTLKLSKIGEVTYETVLYVGWRQIVLLHGTSKTDGCKSGCTILEEVLYLISPNPKDLIQVVWNHKKGKNHEHKIHYHRRVLSDQAIAQLSSTDSQLFLVSGQFSSASFISCATLS